MKWEPGKPLITQTERFVVRSLGPKDAGPIYTSWWNDAEIQKGFNFEPRGWNQERAAKHIATFDNKKKFHLGIFDKQTKKVIGFFAILPNYTSKVAMTNICVGNRDWWGKGVTKEVRAHLLPFIYNTLGMAKVEGEIHGRNLPSIYNYKAMGFTPEAVVRKHLVSPYGDGRVDVYHFGLLKDEWQRMKAAGRI